MARPIWKGHITFGLVNVPVVLHSGEQRADLSFQLIDSRNQARVRYQRVNDATGEEVPWDQIVKGYEYDDGDYVLLTDEDFRKAAVESSQSVEIERFVDAAEISPIYFDKPYYLVPGRKGEKGYVLLRETLEKTGRAGIAKVVIRTRQYLAALMPLGDGLVLNILRFEQELRDIEDFDPPTGKLGDYKITNKEIDMAARLVESMATEWDPSQYEDDYRRKLMEWIEEKAEKGPAEITEAEEEEAPEEEPGVINIMDLLQQSVEEADKGKKKGGGGKKRKKKAGRKKARRKRAS